MRMVRQSVPDQPIARLLRFECPDVDFPAVDNSLRKLLNDLTNKSLAELATDLPIPQTIFFSSIGCDTSIRTRRNESFICINLNDIDLVDFIFENRKNKKFVVSALAKIKYLISSQYIYTRTMNLFSCALAYENIPPFMLSQIPYSASPERAADFLTSYFRKTNKLQLKKVSICFDFLHEWSHFLMMYAPERMRDFASLAETHFFRFSEAFPSYQKVKEVASSAGWENEIDEELYHEIIQERKDFSNSTFPSMREEVICDVFAVYHLFKHRKELHISYWKLLKVLHAKLNSHHLRVAIKRICEQGCVYKALVGGSQLELEKIDVFFGELFDRTGVASDFLLSFSMDSEDNYLMAKGWDHIQEMRNLNSIFLEAFLFPLRNIIPTIISFAIDKLRNEEYRDSMAYFADKLKPQDLLIFVKDPSFI